MIELEALNWSFQLLFYIYDLRQFSEQISVTEASDLTSATLETYVMSCKHDNN